MELFGKQGFTLIELMVALAVVSILLGIGVPSFHAVVQESRISGQYNAMAGSLYLARSEAIKGPGAVTVCPRTTPTSEECGASNQWSNGWLVFIDNTSVAGEATATIDSDDELISVEPALTGDNTIRAIGKFSSSASADDVAFIRYLQDGGASWSSGSVVVCDTNRGPLESRVMNLVLTGDIRRGRVTDGSAYPKDVFDQPIDQYCPESVS